MSLPRISISRSINQHLAWARQKPLRPFTLMMRTATLRRFQDATAVEWLDELAPAHTDHWLQSHDTPSATDQASKHLRAWLEWSNIRYGMLLYLPPRHYISLPDQSRQQEGEERGLTIGRHLALPHQRLVFLLGFIWGWRLREIQRASQEDIFGVTPMRDDLYTLAEAVAAASPSKTPFLGRWLGASDRSARRAWARWAGCKFGEVNKAGRYARLNRGIRPHPLQHGAGSALWRMPPMDVENVKRMPRVWEG